MGITREHAPELIRMMREDSFLRSRDPGLAFAGAHAARALASVAGIDAWPHLVEILRRALKLNDDLWAEDIEQFLGGLGPGIIAPATRLALDQREGFAMRLVGPTAIKTPHAPSHLARRRRQGPRRSPRQRALQRRRIE